MVCRFHWSALAADHPACKLPVQLLLRQDLLLQLAGLLGEANLARSGKLWRVGKEGKGFQHHSNVSCFIEVRRVKIVLGVETKVLYCSMEEEEDVVATDKVRDGLHLGQGVVRVDNLGHVDTCGVQAVNNLTENNSIPE